MKQVWFTGLMAAATLLSRNTWAQDAVKDEPSAEAPQPSEPPYIGPETRVYTQADIPRNLKEGYPPRAANAEVEGSVTINCEVGPDYRLTRCVIERESPIGYGFGEATVFLFLKYAQVKSDHRAPGEWQRFTYKWTLG